MPMNSPIDFAYLKQMYDSEVVIGEKTPDELLGWLQNQFDLAEVSFSILFSSILTELIKCNAEQAITNVKKLSRDDMTFHVFRILDTERNRRYSSDIFDDVSQKEIYIVIVMNTGYVQTNHQKLLLDLEIRRGVTQFDFDNKTPAYQHWLFCIYALEHHEY